MIDIEKRLAWFNGEQQPARDFSQTNVRPLIKYMQAITSETVDRMYGEPYPRIEDL